jgi:hypothetical protein
MDPALKRAWAAAAVPEMRRGDMGRDQAALDDAIGEALYAGTLQRHAQDADNRPHAK